MELSKTTKTIASAIAATLIFGSQAANAETVFIDNFDNNAPLDVNSTDTGYWQTFNHLSHTSLPNNVTNVTVSESGGMLNLQTTDAFEGGITGKVDLRLRFVDLPPGESMTFIIHDLVISENADSQDPFYFTIGSTDIRFLPYSSRIQFAFRADRYFSVSAYDWDTNSPRSSDWRLTNQGNTSLVNPSYRAQGKFKELRVTLDATRYQVAIVYADDGRSNADCVGLFFTGPHYLNAANWGYTGNTASSLTIATSDFIKSNNLVKLSSVEVVHNTPSSGGSGFCG